MKKGDIVRKITRIHKSQVGPYLRVIGPCTSQFVRAQVIGTNEETYIPKSSYTVISCAKVQLSRSIIERLSRGSMASLIHDATPMWQRIHDTKPQLIFVTNRISSSSVMLHVEKITTLFYKNVKCVRVFLGTKVYETF
jgi:hypothetical protein